MPDENDSRFGITAYKRAFGYRLKKPEEAETAKDQNRRSQRPRQ